MYLIPDKFECENYCIGVCMNKRTTSKNRNYQKKVHLGHIAEGSARVLNGQNGPLPEEQDFITHVGIFPRQQSQE